MRNIIFFSSQVKTSCDEVMLASPQNILS